MNKKTTIYWAGARCFVSTLRHFDLKTIKILKKDFHWAVHYPTKLVSNAIKKSPSRPLLYGKAGLIRETCLEFVKKSDIVVAYTGLDMG